MGQGLIGVIGGSGLYQMEGFTGAEEVRVETPFGPASDAVIVGSFAGRRVGFLPRHGRGHLISPHEVNYRANVFALKALGAERILSVSAVGSLKEALAPEHMVVPDQFVDRTRQRVSSFFGRGLVAHVAFARPVCGELARVVTGAARDAGVVVHEGGAYVCIEGPQFSTRAESELYRSWGMDVIGMTALPEAKLAREAEICYATLAMVTDYDCWHPDHDSVTAERVIRVLGKNVERAARVLGLVIERLPEERACECGKALASAFVTAPALVPDAVKKELRPIIGKYMA